MTTGESMRTYTTILYRKILIMLDKGKTPKEISNKIHISRSLVYTAKFRMSKVNSQHPGNISENQEIK